MYIYKAIIWLSLIAIIGEWVIFSGLDFVPNKDASGEVLGERTYQTLDDLAFKRFPASYYADAMQSTAPQASDQVPSNPAEKNNASAVVEEPLQAPANNSRDALVQILNTPSQYEIAFPHEQAIDPARDDTSVDAIIKKNERLYREQIIKELNTIKDQYKDINNR